MDHDLIQTYAADLKANLGTAKFDSIFERLKADSAIHQGDAVTIAGILLEAKVAPSTARSAALARIAKLHNSLVTFKLKQRAVGGRSAA